MWNARNRHFAQQFFGPDDGNPGGEGNPPETPPKLETPPKEEKVTFTPEQQQHLNDLLARERKDAEDRTALRLKSEADTKADADRKALEQEESERKGEYETAKTQLTGERDTAVQARDKALELLKANVDTQWDPLPDEVKATYTGEDDDVLAKSEHMRLMKPIIDRLQTEAKKESERENPGSRKDPPPSGKTTTTDQDEEARRRMRPRL